MKNGSADSRCAAALELSHWLVDVRRSQKELAAELGCSAMSVSCWRHGHYKPTRELAVKLEQLTAGRVTVAMWDAP